MKKTLLLAAALACSGAVAQEKQVWACQQIEGTMLNWENNSWENYGVAPYNILFTLDTSTTGSVKKSNEDSADSLTCNYFSGLVSCHDLSLGTHYYFNRASGKLGFSALFGAIWNTPNRDSVGVSIFNCTKF